MEKLTYEQSIKRLEEIAAEMEIADITLDDSMRLFEEGTRLSSFCSKYLEDAKQKITKLSKD